MAYFSEGAIDFYGLERLTYEDRSLMAEILTKIREEEKEQMKKGSGPQAPPNLPGLPKLPTTTQKYSSRTNIPRFPGKR